MALHLFSVSAHLPSEQLEGVSRRVLRKRAKKGCQRGWPKRGTEGYVTSLPDLILDVP